MNLNSNVNNNKNLNANLLTNKNRSSIVKHIVYSEYKNKLDRVRYLLNVFALIVLKSINFINNRDV